MSFPSPTWKLSAQLHSLQSYVHRTYTLGEHFPVISLSHDPRLQNPEVKGWRPQAGAAATFLCLFCPLVAFYLQCMDLVYGALTATGISVYSQSRQEGC